MTTRLEIINDMLASIGEQPQTSADSQHPSVISAAAVLNKVDKRVQSRKWWFNQERGLTLSKNAQGQIILPSNTLSVDPVDTSSPLVQRGNMLYDRRRHTFVIDEAVVVNLVVQLPIQQLPFQAADYISAYAVHSFYVNEDGDAEKATEYAREKFTCYAELRSEHLKNSDLNAKNRPAAAALLYRVRPGRGLTSHRNPNLIGGLE